MSTATQSNRFDAQQIQASWDGVAGGYDDFVTESHFALSREVLDRAGLRPGTLFLDVAAGSGSLSIPAARAGASVVATDISPIMVRRLEERVHREGLSGVDVRVMDGQALDLQDDTFDLTGSQFGVMLFPDVQRGIDEMTRVTKPGGRVVLVTFGPPPKMEFLGFFLTAIKSVMPGFTGLPSDPPPLAFQLADPERLRQRFVDSGLRDVSVETTAERLEFGSGAEMWNWVTSSNPIGAGLVAGLSDDQRAEALRVLDGLLQERKTDSGTAVITSPVHVGIGTK